MEMDVDVDEAMDQWYCLLNKEPLIGTHVRGYAFSIKRVKRCARDPYYAIARTIIKMRYMRAVQQKADDEAWRQTHGVKRKFTASH